MGYEVRWAEKFWLAREEAAGSLYSTSGNRSRAFTPMGVQLVVFRRGRQYQILWEYSVWVRESRVLQNGNKRFLKCLLDDYKGVISM